MVTFVVDAISLVGNHEIELEFSLPATNEVILLSIERLNKKMKEKVAPELVNEG
jgi:xanthine dehydrogenase molybdopterin-binding subunit B